MSFRKHRYISKILIFAIIMYCSFITISATGNSGTCGPNATWSYNEQTRTLTISGSGAISGYEQLTVINGSLARTAAAPWNAYSNEIRSIIIGEGITSIGESAFKHYDNLENLKLPSTLLQIENYAFSRCGSLDRVVIPEVPVEQAVPSLTIPHCSIPPALRGGAVLPGTAIRPGHGMVQTLSTRFSRKILVKILSTAIWKILGPPSQNLIGPLI